MKTTRIISIYDDFSHDILQEIILSLLLTLYVFSLTALFKTSVHNLPCITPDTVKARIGVAENAKENDSVIPLFS